MSHRDEQFNFLVDVAKQACTQGADGAEVMLKKGQGLSLKTERGTLGEVKVSGSQTLGVRVFRQNKVGISYTQDISQQSLDFMLSTALSSLNFLEEDPYQQLSEIPQGQGPLINEHPKNLSPAGECAQMPISHKKNFVLDLENQVLSKASHVRSAPYNGLSENHHEHYLVNHLGPVSYAQSSSVSCYTSALIEEDAHKSMIYEVMLERSYGKLDAKKCAETAYEKARMLLDGTSLTSGKYDVIFDPDIVSDLFAVFGEAFSAKSALEGKNPWATKLGQQVAHAGITLSDVPDYKLAFHYSLFDDEGVKQRPLDLISYGELKNFYHNSRTAKVFCVPNTAHASRSPGGPLGVSGTTQVMHKGTLEKSELYRGKTLFIMDIQGLHSGADPISGHFSLGAKGILMNNGKFERAFNDVTLSGNFYQMLLRLELLGDELQGNKSKNFFAPELRFQNMDVSGSN